MIRIFSEYAKQNFLHDLESKNWNQIYSYSDVNEAYDFFHSKVTESFETNFRLVRLSRKRAKDKKWITPGLKKSSRQKNKLYQRWLKTKRREDADNYKRYKKEFTAVSRACENAYFKELFDKNTNTMKQLWKNLNMVCSLSNKSHSKQSVTKLTVNNKNITDQVGIANEFNKYFCTVGENLSKRFTDASSKVVPFQNGPIPHAPAPFPWGTLNPL